MVRKKAFPKIHTLGHIKSYVSEETIIYLYKSLVLSQIEYADIVYDGLSQTNSDYLQKIQNAGLRTALNCDPRTPISVLHDMAGLKPLKARRKDRICQYVYRGVNNMSTSEINSMFVTMGAVSTRATRAVKRGDLVVPHYGLSLCRRSFAYQGAVYYNSIEWAVRELPMLNQFKKALIDPG